MRGHPYQACTTSINRHAGFVQTYEFKSVSQADSLKFGTHPDQATRTAAIENVDRHDSSKRRRRRVDGSQQTVAQSDLVPKSNANRPADDKSVGFGMSASEQVVLGRSPSACGRLLPVIHELESTISDSARQIKCRLRQFRKPLL